MMRCRRWAIATSLLAASPHRIRGTAKQQPSCHQRHAPAMARTFVAIRSTRTTKGRGLEGRKNKWERRVTKGGREASALEGWAFRCCPNALVGSGEVGRGPLPAFRLRTPGGALLLRQRSLRLLAQPVEKR